MKLSLSAAAVLAAQANTLAADTSGVVTATISDEDMATLAGLTETGNASSITITIPLLLQLHILLMVKPLLPLMPAISPHSRVQRLTSTPLTPSMATAPSLGSAMRKPPSPTQP